MKQESFDVEVAKNGEEALIKLKERRPDFLVLDIVLPQVDGWEILNIYVDKKTQKLYYFRNYW